MKKKTAPKTPLLWYQRHLTFDKNFLDNRKQSVVMNGTHSNIIPISSGVPKGSVLGLVLFLACINDLPEQVRSRVEMGGFWLPVFTLLTTCRQGTSKYCRYGEYSVTIFINARNSRLKQLINSLPNYK